MYIQLNQRIETSILKRIGIGKKFWNKYIYVYLFLSFRYIRCTTWHAIDKPLKTVIEALNNSELHPEERVQPEPYKVHFQFL